MSQEERNQSEMNLRAYIKHLHDSFTWNILTVPHEINPSWWEGETKSIDYSFNNIIDAYGSHNYMKMKLELIELDYQLKKYIVHKDDIPLVLQIRIIKFKSSFDEYFDSIMANADSAMGSSFYAGSYVI